MYCLFPIWIMSLKNVQCDNDKLNWRIKIIKLLPQLCNICNILRHPRLFVRYADTKIHQRSFTIIQNATVPIPLIPLNQFTWTNSEYCILIEYRYRFILDVWDKLGFWESAQWKCSLYPYTQNHCLIDHVWTTERTVFASCLFNNMKLFSQHSLVNNVNIP